MKKKMIGIFLCMLLITTVLPISSTVGNKEVNTIVNENLLNGGWSKTFGGNEDDIGYCVQQTSDGGYIIIGETNSFGTGDYDAWLIKTDADGNEEWNKLHGGPDNDGGFSVQETTDGGYIISGFTFSYAVGEYDAWLLKTDSNGDEMWNTTFGGTGFDNAGISFQTDDGGYIIQGMTDSFGAGGYDGWLIKTDENGTEQWNQTYGGSGHEFTRDLAMTSDGGYTLIGQKLSEGLFPKVVVWLIKTDSDGNVIWDKTYKGKFGHSFGTCAQPTSDGGYIITGQTKGFSLAGKWLGRGDTWLIKTDGDGNKDWEKTFGRFIFEDCCFYIIQTSDDGYLLAGFTDGLGGFITQLLWNPITSKAYLIKTDVDGNKEWDEKLGKSACVYVQETIDGGCITVGYTGNPNNPGDLILVKRDTI